MGVIVSGCVFILIVSSVPVVKPGARWPQAGVCPVS